MGDWLIGCGQITWPRDVSEEQVLADIAAAGYAGAPIGPKPATSAAERAALWQRSGLAPAPGYIGADFWDPNKRASIIAQTTSYAQFAREVGVTACYVAANVDSSKIVNGRTRMQAAGHVTAADGLTDHEWTQFIDTITEVGTIMRAHGVTAAFHNHVGSFVETRAELDRLMHSVSPDVLALGPDTGHMAWAGDDVVAMVRDYAPRIVTMHLKDVNAAAAAKARAEQANYRAAESYGVWTELGLGCVDFPKIFALLREHAFHGWLIVETDVTQLPTPLASAQQSRAYLRSLGL
jgi:inosose dehydratase